MNTPYQHPASPSPNPSAETLEPRRLLSAVVENGVLVVTGTPFDDTIRIWENRSSASTVPLYYVGIVTPSLPGSAEDHVIPGDGIRSVWVRALGGNDFVGIYPLPDPGSFPLRLPTRIDGGTGDDELIASGAHASIYGGFGNDTIYGSEQSDWIDGGWGNDVISGNDGNDIIFGRYGNDTLSGDAGDDRLYGGPGDDQLGYYAKIGGPEDHEPGNDLLVGGTGNDRLIGGAGTDRLLGGPGVDQFFYLDTKEEMLDWTPGEPTDYQPPIR